MSAPDSAHSPGIKSKLIKVGVAVLIIGTAGYVAKTIYMKFKYNNIINRKQEELFIKKKVLLKKLENLKSNTTNWEEITSLGLEELVAKMGAGKYDPVDVLHAYQNKALLEDKQYNFITDINANAEGDLRAAMTRNGSLKGVPLSVKDTYFVKGCDCTFGMPSLCFQPAEKDCVMVRTLRNQGAVPFVITNMSQTGKSIESSNPVFGQTLNPHNKERTSGGSSGGEAAILASGASIIGIGGDVGGSIRIPASYCGVFGLKPTSGRLTVRHKMHLFPTQNMIRSSDGPMARTFADLLMLFKALTCGDLYHLDPYCPPVCFNEKIFHKIRPLTIGYYTKLSENQVTPVPAVVRAVQSAKTTLESKGHKLLEFTIPNVEMAIFDIYLKCLFTDGGYGFVNMLVKDNPVDPSIAMTVKYLQIPNVLKKLFSVMMYPFDKNKSKMLHSLAGVDSVYNLWELKDKLDAYKEEVLTKWQNEKIDGLICPVLPITAPPCKSSKNVMDILAYSAIYNILDYAAGSVPVTKVNQSDIEELMNSYPTDTKTYREIVSLQKDSLGMPVGVQCVALPWREEICLRIMRDIDTKI